ncbi:hypothetical protein ACJX0J_024383, partial [Zea mays]
IRHRHRFVLRSLARVVPSESYGARENLAAGLQISRKLGGPLGADQLLAVEPNSPWSRLSPWVVSLLSPPTSVKVVRESMNQMIEAWKEIPGAEEDECSSALPPASQSQRRCSLTGSASDGRYLAASLGSNSVPSATRKSILSVSRSSPPDVSTSVTITNSPSSIRNKKLSLPSYHKVCQANNCDYKVDIVVSLDATPMKVVTEEKLLKGRGVRDRLESRRTLFKGSKDRSAKLAAHKAGSQVVPYEGGGNLEEISEVEGGSE